METLQHITIQAAQMICSNLRPADYTADVGKGYKTIFHSRDLLSQSELSEAEERIFYSPRSSQPVKRIYFRTASGLFVVGQVAPLEELDDFGRNGATLSHLLFLRPEEFALIGNDPFLVLDTFGFATNLCDLHGDKETGNIVPATVNLTLASKCTVDERFTSQENLLLQFSRVSASLAPQMSPLPMEVQNTGASWPPIALQGNEDEVTQTLRTLLALMPPTLRAGSFFDTLFTGGSLKRIPCAAFGVEERDSAPIQASIFDVPSGLFRSRQTASAQTLWERWITKTLSQPSLPHARTLASTSEHVFEWQRWLAGETATPPGLDARTFSELRRLDEPAVQRKIARQLETQCGAALSSRFRASAEALGERDPEALIEALAHGFSQELLIEWGLQACNQPVPPKASELEALARLAKDSDSRWLTHLIWRWQNRWPQMDESLRTWPDADFQRFAAWALNTISLRVEWQVQPKGTGLSTGLAVTASPAPDAIQLIECLIQSTLPQPTVSAFSKDKSDSKGSLFTHLLRRSDAESDNHSSSFEQQPRSVPERWVWLLGALMERANGEVTYVQ